MVSDPSPQLVTGAFGCSGRFNPGRLPQAGHEVRTLTDSPERAHPFGSAIRAFPLRPRGRNRQLACEEP